jgi:hypothetical protein
MVRFAIKEMSRTKRTVIEQLAVIGISLVTMELKIEGVLLSGESNVNQAQKPCLVKRKLADFKRFALAASFLHPETLTGHLFAIGAGLTESQ